MTFGVKDKLSQQKVVENKLPKNMEKSAPADPKLACILKSSRFFPINSLTLFILGFLFWENNDFFGSQKFCTLFLTKKLHG